MKTDRELLELAAKAADEGIVFYGECWRAQNGHEWNPLINDGDALRLAVKTKVILKIQSEVGMLLIEEGDQPSLEHAVRRAVVRAAAALQEAKEPVT